MKPGVAFLLAGRSLLRHRVRTGLAMLGIVIGIAGLLALFLTILFVVKGSIMFPAAAALGWAVLVYIGIDFGFWGKVFDMSAGAERIWRACGEAILSATLLVFLFAYLNLSRWHVRYAHITIAWLVALAALIGVAVFDPAVASGIARMSLALIAVFGLALVIYLSTHGFDRAVLLIPTWLLLVVWAAGAGLAVTGVVTNDIIGPALLGGLVLIEPFVVERLRGGLRALYAATRPLLWLTATVVTGLNAFGVKRTRFRFVDYEVYDEWVRSRLTSFWAAVRYMGPWVDLQTMPVISYLRAFRMLFAYRPAWEAVDCPVLVIHGRKAELAESNHGPLAPALPHGRTRVLEASHFVLTDNMAGVAGAIEEFVRNDRGETTNS